MIEKPFEGDNEYGDDMGNKVMSIMSREDCIGCGRAGADARKNAIHMRL